MMKDCADSRNQRLIDNLAASNITPRLRGLVNIVTSRHYHCWNQRQYDQGPRTLFECLAAENEWNPRYFGVFNPSTSEHARYISNQLEFLVREIDSIYDQTNSLMLGACVYRLSSE
ncbi:unnamed protein product, partial [Mesorhabditis belari]|uniref:Uncharacterized protein n=1 Tax=Mesorhabditis belari TaxID=2138241 RepID=A0AAF3F5P6_9BILA